jgi:chitin deacetylase
MHTGLGEYPETFDPAQACSYRKTGCQANTDIVTLPKLQWAINFDDGPLPPSETLYDFLDQEHKLATHFWVTCYPVSRLLG